MFKFCQLPQWLQFLSSNEYFPIEASTIRDPTWHIIAMVSLVSSTWKEFLLLFSLSFGHWFSKRKGPVVLQKRPQCGFVWGHFFTLWFRFCLLGQRVHRSGVRSPFRTLRTRVPWWRRRLPSFCIVTVSCFFPPLELTSKPKFSRKKSKFGQVYFASTLERAGGLHASALAGSPAGVWKLEF